MSASNTTSGTCASCRNLGRAYWNDGYTVSHHCGKERERRAEGMPRGSDLFAHFRTFFDAYARQRACRHYEERPVADAAVVAHLQAMAEGGGRAEFKFLTEGNRLAEKWRDLFWQERPHATGSTRAHRVYEILPVGTAELERVAAGTGEKA
jgi:hypothetical protein